MAESPLASNNPFRRKTATPASASAAPPVDETEASGVFDAAAAPTAPTLDRFRDQLRALPKSSETPPPTTSFRKPKVVKKVRVQSPPPSSPSSPDSTAADFEARFPASGTSPRHDSSSSDSSDDAEKDPFQNDIASPAEPPANPRQPVTTPQKAPPNPFQKTLKDLDLPSKDASQRAGPTGEPSNPGTPAAKVPLDVGSFGRLLLTGQAGSSAAASSVPTINAPAPSASQPTPAPGDAGSITDASSVSRQSIFDPAHALQETPRTSHELSDTEDDESGLIQTPQAPAARTTLRKKKPPPPSSRHGRLIKMQLKSKDGAQIVDGTTPRTGASATPIYPSSSKSGRPSSSSSDLNKPLPAPPMRRSVDEDPESVFDREAAGKIPEVDIDPDAPDEAIPPPRPPTPPNASHTVSTPSKKPAPPPRRHARTDSKAPSIAPSISTPATEPAADEDHIPARSSFESTRSISSSIRLTINAPAPPPPRRPNHAPRPSASFISPSTTSFSSASSPSALSDADRSPAWPTAAPATAGHTIAGAVSPVKDAGTLSPGPAPALSKLSPPPPPPARSASVRTPAGRPPSISGGVDAPARRISRENMAPPPPPPPPRARGGSRGSVDGMGMGGPALGARRRSAESVRLGSSGGAGGGAGEHGGISVVTEEPAEMAVEGNADGILADLDALQKEVDALRAAGAGGGG